MVVYFAPLNYLKQTKNRVLLSLLFFPFPPQDNLYLRPMEGKPALACVEDNLNRLFLQPSVGRVDASS